MRRRISEKGDQPGDDTYSYSNMRRNTNESREGGLSKKTIFFGLVISQILLICYIYANPNGLIGKTVISRVDSLVGGRKVHAVVIDAGSTGSRVLAFSLHYSLLTNQLVLDDELWHEIKPGLSSFADNPKQGGDTIQQLIDIAKGRIPESYWPKTPVTLKATAGLRLLPSDQADTLLNTVQSVIEKSGFLVLKDEPSVEIMAGLDEGIFGWVTINFLLNTLTGPPGDSVVALDLGGGSTQITFLPTADKTIKSAASDRIHTTKVTGSPSTIYSHSYLGAGLNAARKAALELAGGSVDGATIKVTSPCSLGKDAVEWKFHDTTFLVSGSDQSTFDTCSNLVKQLIQGLGIERIEELQSRELVAFSYFYDRGVDAGLFGKDGGIANPAQYKKVAQINCSKYDENNPFLCFDLTFIYELFTTGYGFGEEQRIGLYKKIAGHETSWALGAAFSMLQKL